MSEPTGSPAAKLHTEIHGTNNAEFRTLTLETAELANTIEILEADYKAKKALLEPYLKNAGVNSVKVLRDPKDPDSYIRVTLAKGRTTRKVSIEKLQKLNVPQATIMAAITETTGDPGIRITTKASKEDEAEAA